MIKVIYFKILLLMNIKTYIFHCLFLVFSFHVINAQNSLELVDSLVIFRGSESYLQKNFEEKVNKVNKAFIYFDSKGYDELTVFLNKNKIIDTILKKPSLYFSRVFNNKERVSFKNKVLCFNLIDSKKYFKLFIDNDYKSIIIIPHINEELIKSFDKTNIGEPSKPVFMKNKDYIEIHLLDFDYYEYLENSLQKPR